MRGLRGRGPRREDDYPQAHGVEGRSAVTSAACPFCTIGIDRVFYAGPLVIGFWDAFPVNPGHALLAPRRHVASWFEATPEERAELMEATVAPGRRFSARMRRTASTSASTSALRLDRRCRTYMCTSSRGSSATCPTLAAACGT